MESMSKKINFKNKKILITGGAGFIGSNLAFYIQNNFPDASIVIFDKFNSGERFDNGNLKYLGNFKNLIGFNGRIVAGDISSKKDLDTLNEYKFDFIFHQAAFSDTRVYDQNEIFRVNINSFYPLLNLAKENGSTLVYASSASTYGQLPGPNQIGKESPENPYGYSKFSMDKIAKIFCLENPNINVVGLRFFNVYGNREFFKGKTASMIIQLGHQILSNQSVKLFEDSDNIYRDFVHIDDVVQANINAALSNISGVFNVGSGYARSFVEVTNVLSDLLGIKCSIDFMKNPYLDYQKYTLADLSLSKQKINYRPKYKLEDGIDKYLPEIVDTYEKYVRKIN